MLTPSEQNTDLTMEEISDLHHRYPGCHDTMSEMIGKNLTHRPSLSVEQEYIWMVEQQNDLAEVISYFKNLQERT